MKIFVACQALVSSAFLALSSGAGVASEVEVVGTWEGFDFPLYSKLVISDEEEWLTYCAVSSCRSIQCFDMAYEGTLDGTFSYSDDLRSWNFERLSQYVVRGHVTTVSGTSAEILYEIETPLPLTPGG